MSSLFVKLAKAKSRLFGSAPQDIPVPFEVSCDCGHRVTGIRRTTYQISVCSACHTSIYVLPVNVYPANRRIRSEVVDGPILERVGTVVRDLVQGDVAAETSNSDRRPVRQAEDPLPQRDYGAAVELKPKSRKNRSKKRDQNAEELPTAAEQAVPSETLIRVPRKPLATQLKQLFSATRLLALAGLGILSFTVWWTVHQSSLENARKVWRVEMDRAETALKERNLVQLEESLALAVDAATKLQRSDVEFHLAHALLKQTKAAQQLTSVDLVTQLSGIVQQDGSLDTSKASSNCRALHGQQMVFDAVLRESKVPADLQLDFPLIVDGLPLDVIVTSDLLRRLSAERPGESVLFAAQIEECRPPSEAYRRWTIILNGSSCALVTTDLHAEELGFDTRLQQGISETVLRQAEFLRKEFGRNPQLLMDTSNSSAMRKGAP